MKTLFRDRIDCLREADRQSGDDSAFEVANAGTDLLHVLGELAGDELDVIGLVVERLRLGRTAYGQLDVASDGRDFARESRDEAVDMLIYEAIGTFKRSSTASWEEGRVRSSVPSRLGGGELNEKPSTAASRFGGNPFAGPWALVGNTALPCSARLVDEADAVVGYVRPEYAGLIRHAPALLAAAELMESAPNAAACALSALVRLVHGEGNTGASERR